MKYFMPLLVALVLCMTLAGNVKATGASTFTITNAQAEPLSPLTLSTAGGDTSLVIGGQQTLTVDPQQAVQSVTINGQTVPTGAPQRVSLPSGKTAQVTWPSPGEVEVMDIDIVQRPSL